MTMYTHLEQNLNFIMLSKHKIVLVTWRSAGRAAGRRCARARPACAARWPGAGAAGAPPTPRRTTAPAAARTRSACRSPACLERDVMLLLLLLSRSHLWNWRGRDGVGGLAVFWSYCCYLAYSYRDGEGEMVLEASRCLHVIVAVSLTLIELERERKWDALFTITCYWCRLAHSYKNGETDSDALYYYIHATVTASLPLIWMLETSKIS